jgi:hypothetical protein
MNKLFLIIFILTGYVLNAQVESDRFGYISSTEVIPNNGLQIEGGQMRSTLDYNSPRLLTLSEVLVRQGASDIHEFRLGFQYENVAEDVLFNMEWLTAGVKLNVLNSDKLNIAAIGTFGIDLRTVLLTRGPDYFLQLAAPFEYKFNEKTSILSEFRFNHFYEQSDINIGFKQRMGKYFTITPSMINHFLLRKRGMNEEKPEWNELSYASIAIQGSIGDLFALDVGLLRPILTGKDQLDPSDGLVLKAGFVLRIPHKPWNKNKVQMDPSTY